MEFGTSARTDTNIARITSNFKSTVSTIMALNENIPLHDVRDRMRGLVIYDCWSAKEHGAAPGCTVRASASGQAATGQWREHWRHKRRTSYIPTSTHICTRTCKLTTKHFDSQSIWFYMQCWHSYIYTWRLGCELSWTFFMKLQNGQTALQLACTGGHLETVKLITQQGCDLHSQNDVRPNSACNRTNLHVHVHVM